MKGKMVKQNNVWYIQYKMDSDLIATDGGLIPLSPYDVNQIEEDSERFDNIEARIAAYPEVEFEMITNPYIDTIFAKLIPTAEQTNGERFDEFTEKTTEGLCDAKPPYVSDDFQIGPDGAYEHQEPEKISWNELFTDLESKLNVYVPLRAINYIKNNYKKPKRKK